MYVPPDGASATLEALATSQAFVDALARDVHVLMNSFALTWEWLASAPPTSRVPLRWEYGALAVFQRVWVTNHWGNVAMVLNTDVNTSRAFYATITAAFLDKIAASASAPLDDERAVLHAIASLFSLYLLWATQPPSSCHVRVWDAIVVDPDAYTALLQLPGRAHACMDLPYPAPGGASGDAPPSSPPAAPPLPPRPSADVWFVLQWLLGNVSGAPRGGALQLRFLGHTHTPRRRAETALMSRAQRSAVADMSSSTDALNRSAPMHANAMSRSILEALGVPSAMPATSMLHSPVADGGASSRTAKAVDGLQATQNTYKEACAQAERTAQLHAGDSPAQFLARLEEQNERALGPGRGEGTDGATEACGGDRTVA
ncbi:hypothetical protein MSPP1_003754 [Malassezia sp. CBS 17886]|nr:hypothetical protein MSPP1_003754 [Malassezia sp. CBS 17886]